MTLVRELEPGLCVTELDLPEFSVRGAVLVGRERALVWDTLSHPRDMVPVAPLVAGRPLTVVYSHADWDHVWGTGGLAPDEVVGQEICRRRFDTDVPATLDEKRAAEPGAWDDVRLVPPTRTFTAELTLDLGDLTCVLHHLPGHTPDCCVAFLPERGVLLLGDTVETPLPVINDAGAVTAWIAALAPWAADPRVRLVIPAHGSIGGRKIISDTIAYLDALRSDTPPRVPDALTAFYRETHRENLQRMQERRRNDHDPVPSD